MLQASHMHGCVQLLQLSLHTKMYKNHCSTSGVIAIFVVVSALLPESLYRKFSGNVPRYVYAPL